MKVLTPMKAIRAKCLDCMCDQVKEIRLCPTKKCTLYPYRMGRRPKEGDITPNTPDDQKNADSPMFFR